MSIGECIVKSRQLINILGIKFDENLKWTIHIERAIKESNKLLPSI
jgi:hypothetical protein